MIYWNNFEPFFIKTNFSSYLQNSTINAFDSSSRIRYNFLPFIRHHHIINELIDTS